MEHRAHRRYYVRECTENNCRWPSSSSYPHPSIRENCCKFDHNHHASPSSTTGIFDTSPSYANVNTGIACSSCCRQPEDDDRIDMSYFVFNHEEDRRLLSEQKWNRHKRSSNARITPKDITVKRDSNDENQQRNKANNDSQDFDRYEDSLYCSLKGSNYVDGKDHNDNNDDGERIWIFGYGSICWNPGFMYEKSLTGFIEGFSRKFWQGSITHRGTDRNPGRVATLIEEEDKKAIVWGRVFQVRKERVEVMDYLENRECSSGGYTPITLTVHLKDHLKYGVSTGTVTAVTYVALADNYLWLGDASLNDISSQMVSCKGHAGHNIEYLLRLADYMRLHIPQETDSELFALEHLVMQHIRENQLSLKDVMGGCAVSEQTLSVFETNASGRLPTRQQTFDVVEQQQMSDTTDNYNNRQQQAIAASSSSSSSFSNSSGFSSSKFASMIPDKKLRCLNI